MFYSVTNMELLSRSDAQFAVGIALAQMNIEEEVIERLICYGGSYWNGSQSNPTAARDREQIDEFVRVYDGSILSAVIDYFAKSPVLSVKAKGNRGGVGYTALGAVLSEDQLKELYQIAMQIVFTYGTTKLLLPYMDTSYFRRNFRKALNSVASVGANGFGRNNLAQNVEDAVLDDFKLFVTNFSCNGYSTISGNPTGYLINAFKSFYVLDSKKKNSQASMFNIINRLGQDRVVGEDDTALSDNSIKINRPRTKLNFIVTATKIERASHILFSHNGSSTNYYDIFSHYRDSILSERYKELRSQVKKIIGTTISITAGSPDFLGLTNSSLATKFGHKKEYCDKLVNTVLKKGFRREDTYGIYKSLVAITESQAKTDGIRVFSTPDHSVKSVMCNSEIFQVLLEGYCALRDLLHYIDAGDALSLQAFPVDIFRDGSLIKRFKTVESYIANHDYVCGFVNEINADGNRKATVINSLYSNEYIYSALESTMLLKSNEVIEALRELPMSAITGAVRKTSKMSEDAVIMKEFNIVYDNMIKTIGNNSGDDLQALCMSWYPLGEVKPVEAFGQIKNCMQKLPDAVKLNASFAQLEGILASGETTAENASLVETYGEHIQVRRLDCLHYLYTMQLIHFLNILEVFARSMNINMSEGTTSIRGTTQAAWGIPTQSIVDFSAKLMEPFISQNSDKEQVVAVLMEMRDSLTTWICTAIQELTGKPFSSITEGKNTWTTDDLMQAYNVKELISIYMMASSKVLNMIAKNQATGTSKTDPFFLSYAIAASNLQLIHLKFPVAKLNDLIGLYNSTGSRQRYGYSMQMEDRANHVALLNVVKLAGINNFMKYAYALPRLFNTIDERSYKVITATGYLADEEPEVVAALKKAAASSIYDVQTAANPAIARTLCDNYAFDSDGYLRDGSTRFSYKRVINGDNVMGGSTVTSYIHSSGVIVNIYIDNTYDTEVITDSIMSNLKLALKMSTGR